jgi:hypothetical protein
MVTSPNCSRTRRTSRRSGRVCAVGYIFMCTVRAAMERAFAESEAILKYEPGQGTGACCYRGIIVDVAVVWKGVGS